MDGYYAFMLVATALVLMMTVPALALFYGGMSRSKSVLNMMMMSYVALGDRRHRVRRCGAGRWASAGDGDGSLFADPFDLFGARRRHRTDELHRGVMFQLTFAAITVALIRGADRRPGEALGLGRLRAPLGHALLLPDRAHGFGPPGLGFVSKPLAAQDYAGGTVVHINAGIAGLVLALIIGKRIGFGKEPMRPHNLTLTMIGAGLLWFGWYGFNVGSIVFARPT